MSAPVFIIAGFADTGKTTYICALIAALKAEGLSVAVLKDAREHALAASGKDSDRFLRADADAVGLCGSDASMLLYPAGADLAAMLLRLPAVDIVLAEGFKRENFPQIGLYRAASGQPLPAAPERYTAIVTDTPLQTEVPQFPLDNPLPLARFLLYKIRSNVP